MVGQLARLYLLLQQFLLHLVAQFREGVMVVRTFDGLASID